MNSDKKVYISFIVLILILVAIIFFMRGCTNNIDSETNETTNQTTEINQTTYNGTTTPETNQTIIISCADVLNPSSQIDCETDCETPQGQICTFKEQTLIAPSYCLCEVQL